MAERLAASRPVARMRAGSAAGSPDHAGLGVRSLAYLIDSLVLFGFTMVFATAAGLNIFLRSDAGRGQPSDSAFLTSTIITLGTIPAWLLVNLLLSLRKSQSIGQYVVGLKVARDDGGRLGPGRLLSYWLALHPLLFHPLLAVPWFALAYFYWSLAGSELLFVVGAAVAFVSLGAPLAGLVFALGDPRRRGIHDWLTGIKVVRVD